MNGQGKRSNIKRPQSVSKHVLPPPVEPTGFSLGQSNGKNWSLCAIIFAQRRRERGAGVVISSSRSALLREIFL
jgi:hypothetical protein